MIEIKEVKSPADLKKFVKFPFKIYRGSPYWIPPIVKGELESFNPLKNPVFEHADARFFMAYKDTTAVGRVAVIVNWTEVRDQGIKKIRFGWLDMIDDIEVTRRLLDKVTEIGKEYQLDYMEGPLGFSNLDKVGVLTEGYDQKGTMVTWYNHPYYVQHLETLGLVREKNYIEGIFNFNNVDPKSFSRLQELIKKRYKLKALNFTSSKDIMPYVGKMFDLFNNSYDKLASHVAISETQINYFKKKYITFINPEYIKFVVDEHDNIIAFAIVMPSFADALQKANGKLFPFGIFHLLRARKKSKEAVFYLIGIEPSYQNKGVTAIIFNEYYKVFSEKGIKTCIRTPELEENTAIHQIWKNFNPKIHKRRSTYKKSI